MKTLLSLVLTLTMMLTLSITVLAENDVQADGNLTGNVGASYTAGSDAVNAGTIYSVSVEWTSIGTLHYQGANGGTYTWNPNTLKYELTGNSAASWTDASIEIDITNKSNTSIMVLATYADKQGDQVQTSMRDWTDNQTLTSVSSAAVSNGQDIVYTDTGATGTAQTTKITGTVTATGTISANTSSVGTITLTLQERGDSPIWQYDGTTLTGVVLGESTDLVIPDDVTEIAPYAFKDQTEITSIVIPSSVKTVGESAFENCTGLQTIGWCGVPTAISKDMFKGCNVNAEVYIWDSACTGSNDACGFPEQNGAGEWMNLFNIAQYEHGSPFFGDIPYGNIHYVHKGEMPVQ